MNYRVYPPTDCHVTIELPASKSISNRALVMDALCEGTVQLDNLALCDDTQVMRQALASTDETVDIHGAGTAMRFLTAYFAQKEGIERILTGSPRMKQRPIAILVDALRSLGADIRYIEREGFPPLRIRGRALSGDSITLSGNISSQYISALLLIAPYMHKGLSLTLTGEIISRPYIHLTLGLMEQWGIAAQFIGNTLQVPAGRFQAPSFRIEADWSAASYWYEIAALVPHADIRLAGLSPHSQQGDALIVRYFKPLGVHTRFEKDAITLHKEETITTYYELNLSGQPDLAQTLVVTCCLQGTPFRFTGLQTLRIKETDRIAALQNELRKLGYNLSATNDSLSWDGSLAPAEAHPVIDTYNDHRMAMAFAPAAILYPGLEIGDIAVVEKSYPDYWVHLTQAGFTLTHHQKGDYPL